MLAQLSLITTGRILYSSEFEAQNPDFMDNKISKIVICIYLHIFRYRNQVQWKILYFEINFFFFFIGYEWRTISQ